jgi:tetratricopeptide (TPR) repeat protein
MTPKGKLVIIAAIASGCLFGRPPEAKAAGQEIHETAPQDRSANQKACPSPDVVENVLGKASDLMEHARYQVAAEKLEPLSSLGCDARISLLLAGALESEGNSPEAEQTLQRAHLKWPFNDSIAASLAREYLHGGQTDKALQALAHFHVSKDTRPQEMEIAVVVYLAAHKLVPAQAVADADYRSHPSVDTLLLLANVLQLQGRYPDVNRLLGSKRESYSDSPKFLITLAESEYDASIYTAAHNDIERALLLDPSSFQAHYILGNVLVRLGDPDRAVTEYREAIQLAPDQPRTYFQLALVLRTKMDSAGEESALNQALAADNHYAPAHCEMGRMLIEQGRFEDAVIHLNSAVEYNPNSEEAYFLLVRAYAKLGQKDKAAAMEKRLVTLLKSNRPGQVK